MPSGQDVYSTPLVSMLEPMVEGMNPQLKTDIPIMKDKAAALNQQWGQVVQTYDDLKAGVDKLDPLETEVVNHANKADTSMEVRHARSFKMQMQDDLNTMTEQSNIILILAMIFVFAAMLFLLVSFV
jgi:hypothetical protein